MTKPDTASQAAGSRLSMHEHVEVWDDCCSCEAEPYWVEALTRAETPPRPDAAAGDRDGAAGD